MYLYVTKMTETLEEVELLLNRSSRQLKKPERMHYKFLKDRLMHQLGDVLIQYAIEQCAGLTPKEWRYHITTMGKVEIRSSCHIYVSLSYSYPYLVCIIDNQPIGIDIEETKDLDYKYLAKNFTTNEFNQVTTLKDFYEIWTKKESYTKLTGEGLVNGLDRYDVTQNLRFLKKQVQFTSVDYFKRLIQICHMSKHSLNFEVVPLTQLL